MTEEILGIKALLDHQLQQNGFGESARSKMLGLYSLAGEKSMQLADKEASIRERNSAGAKAKAKAYQSKKDKVSAIYDTLKSANGGKNPKLKVLCKELEKIYSDEELSSYTIQDWHKKLNKGKPL